MGTELQVHGVDQHLRKAGLRLIAAFHAAMQAAKLYPGANQAVVAAIDELHAIASELLQQEGVIEIRIANGCFFVNQARIPMNLASFAMFGAIERALARFESSAVEILAGVERVEWHPLLAALMATHGGRGAAALDAMLKEAGLQHLRVRREANAPAPRERSDQAKRVYLRSVQVAREVLTSVRVGHAVNVRQVKRSVQAMVDQVLTNQTALVNMTTMRDYDEYTFMHSVNVGILCIVFGHKLGLDKRSLYEVGLCGLLHDLGKMRIDWRLVNKPGKLTEPEWAMMRMHPAEGLLALFETHGFADPPFRQMLAAYEHHMKMDLSGYPRVRRARTPTLFTRLVSIVDTFDAVTSPRSYRAQPWAADEVLRNMRDEPNWGLDPVLVKAFIHATGIYPIGTLVRLSDGTTAVVAEQNPEHLDSPVVRLVLDAQGARITPPTTLDLADTRDASAPRISIVRSVEAGTCDIDPAQVLVPA
jgi:HD-GYP domain-containing protein (c-di-GMP phosphodiesterase class II)